MADAFAQLDMLRNRVRKNRKQLKAWARREGVTCMRLYDRDIPEIPVAVDWYEGRLHVAEYETPRERSEEWARELAVGLGQAMDVAPEHVFVKQRRRQRGSEQYQRVGEHGKRFEVGEGGHRFLVNLGDYLDTGLFLDHRTTRSLVRGDVSGADVVNLFCYTGAFTVYAAAGGARSSVSVDMSNTYTAWAEDNLRLNGADLGRHRVVRANVLEWLEQTPSASFDRAVVDPPTFSNSKRMRGSFDVQRDHVALLGQVLRVLRPGGVCWFSTNHRRFRLDSQALAVACADISEDTIPPDFRNRRIHRCFRLGPLAL